MNSRSVKPGGRLREIAEPFVAALPAGARVRTRLRLSAQDEAVLRAVGRHLGIPTARFSDRLIQMAANAGLHVVVVDPAYSSRWAAQHWLAPLRKHHPEFTGHHAAAVVLGRRGQGHRARNRATRNRIAPEDAMRPAQARTRKPPKAKTANRKPAAPRGTRQPPRRKTGTPHRTTAGNQAPEDRSRAPTEPATTIAQC
jgi:hypothetical protein